MPTTLPPPETRRKHSGPGEPIWDVVESLPRQGDWCEEEYLRLPNEGNRIEYRDGFLEVLPVATKIDQKLIRSLNALIEAAFDHQGLCLQAGYHIRIPKATYRFPDVIYLSPEQDAASNDRFTEAATIVVEVVSPDEPSRDYLDKREEYARAGVPEYWIVDPRDRSILLLVLRGERYEDAGTFRDGDTAVSRINPRLQVDVTALFDAAN